jgi:hypothetical protein
VNFARLLAVAAIALLSAAASTAVTPKPARAQEPITVITVINLPDVVIDNRCNGHPVGLGYGQLTIVTTIVPLGTAGEQVQGTVTYSQNLRGEDLITHEPYRGAEGEFSFSHYLPAGGGRFYDLMWSTLVPQRSGPRMVFVQLLKATINPDFTLSEEVVETYLVCAPL